MEITAIYLIEADPRDGPCKIGIGKNPRSRLHAFQTGNSARLNLHSVYWMKSRQKARFVEYAVLQYFSWAKLNGEWVDQPAWQVASTIGSLIQHRFWDDILRFDEGPTDPPDYDPENPNIATPEEIAAMLKVLAERAAAREALKT